MGGFLHTMMHSFAGLVILCFVGFWVIVGLLGVLATIIDAVKGSRSSEE